MGWALVFGLGWALVLNLWFRRSNYRAHLKMFFKTVFYFEKQASQKKLFLAKRTSSYWIGIDSDTICNVVPNRVDIINSSSNRLS